MDPESKKLLEETRELVEENNQMLHSMRRSMRMQRIMSFLYWIFIIGTAVGAYYFIQPYVNQMVGLYDNVSGTLDSFKK